MRAILIRCPECNAKLTVSASDKETDCEYCGARSQIQHRRGLLERVEPRKAAANALPFAVEGHSLVWRIGIIGIPTLFVAIGIMVAVSQRARRQATVAAITAQQKSATPTPTAVKKPPKRPAWRSQGAALIDVNADDILDVVGRIHQDEPAPTSGTGCGRDCCIKCITAWPPFDKGGYMQSSRARQSVVSAHQASVILRVTVQ